MFVHCQQSNTGMWSVERVFYFVHSPQSKRSRELRKCAAEFCLFVHTYFTINGVHLTLHTKIIIGFDVWLKIYCPRQRAFFFFSCGVHFAYKVTAHYRMWCLAASLHPTAQCKLIIWLIDFELAGVPVWWVNQYKVLLVLEVPYKRFATVDSELF